MISDASITYKTADKYIKISNKLKPLFRNKYDNMLYILYNNDIIQYDPQRDGMTLDKDQAKKIYPEYFI